MLNIGLHVYQLKVDVGMSMKNDLTGVLSIRLSLDGPKEPLSHL